MNVASIEKIVRPLVTLGIAAAFIAGFLLKYIGAEAFLGVAGTVFGFWFQKREEPR